MPSCKREQTTILVVDDHPSVRQLVASAISTALPDYQVKTVERGEEAVGAVTKTPVVAVVMDIGLPGISGIEATRQIKQVFPHLPVIMLSIHEEEQYKADSMRVGASAYVTKRTMGRDLIPILERILAAEYTSDYANSLDCSLLGGEVWSG
ncbi:response regulator transcription factor [Candidatus Bipolaricaulota bacterium]|nr:response regulator transcription factor [Candidatus Bipolaricaulota bacterium]